jgi:hypothetical protein
VPPTKQGPASAQQAQEAESEYSGTPSPDPLSFAPTHLTALLAHMISIFDKSRHTHHTLVTGFACSRRAEANSPRLFLETTAAEREGNDHAARSGRASPINLSTAGTVRPAMLLQLSSASQSLPSCLCRRTLGLESHPGRLFALFPKRPLVAVAWQPDPVEKTSSGVLWAWRTTSPLSSAPYSARRQHGGTCVGSLRPTATKYVAGGYRSRLSQRASHDGTPSC